MKKNYSIILFFLLICLACVEHQNNQLDFLADSGREIVLADKSNDEIEKKEKYPEFSMFWEAFKMAVIHQNKEKVVQFVHFPFIDHFNQAYHPDLTFSSQTSTEFLEKYMTIFDTCVVQAIAENRYRGFEPWDREWDAETDTYLMEDYIMEGQYLLDIGDHGMKNRYFVFEKIGDAFFLTHTPYIP